MALNIIKYFSIFALIFSSGISNAEIIAEDFRVMMAPKVARSTAGYGVIKNTGNEADTLVSIYSDTVEVMFHKTEIDAGIAKMVHLSDVVIAAGEELVLEPLSYHLMLFDFYSAEFKEGGVIRFYLKFKHAGIITVEAVIVSRPDQTRSD